jgi:ABC-type lipoprotein export system ATPase subunit
VVLVARHLRAAFGERVLFDGVDLGVRRGERIVLVGPNGAGKTTLLRIVTGERPSDDPRGVVRWGARVRVGYYDQSLARFDPEATLLETLLRLVGERAAHDLLGRFMFPYEAQFKRVADLSGGERARLALLDLTLQEANVLVLDEPTNHLDLEMIEALEDALDAYEGTLVVVSHDRRLLSGWRSGCGRSTTAASRTTRATGVLPAPAPPAASPLRGAAPPWRRTARPTPRAAPRADPTATSAAPGSSSATRSGSRPRSSGSSAALERAEAELARLNDAAAERPDAVDAGARRGRRGLHRRRGGAAGRHERLERRPTPSSRAASRRPTRRRAAATVGAVKRVRYQSFDGIHWGELDGRLGPAADRHDGLADRPSGRPLRGHAARAVRAAPDRLRRQELRLARRRDGRLRRRPAQRARHLPEGPQHALGPGDDIPSPDWTDDLQYEGELAVVIARSMRDVSADDALSYVLGYTCALDVTARDKQRSDLQWFRAKSADGFCPVGPWLETDLDPGDLRVQTLRQRRAAPGRLTPAT